MYIKQKERMFVTGRVSRNAEMQFIKGDIPLTKFSIKADEKPASDGGKPEPVWLNVICWRDMARVAQHIEKGDVVLVAGKFQSRPWQTDSGKSRISNEITAEFISVQVSAAAVPPVASSLYEESDGFSDITDDDDDDVPF